MLHQWFTCVHLLDTYLANLKEGFQLSFHYPSVSIRAAQSGLQSVPAYRMRWVCHHLFRSYDRNPSNIANIRLYSASGHTNVLAKILIFHESYNKKQRNLFGNGCGKWERLRERLRKNNRFFSCFSSKIILSLQREKEKTISQIALFSSQQ